LDSTRRRFLVRAAATVAAGVAAPTGRVAVRAQQSGRIRSFDHVALPMQQTAAMVAFYRALGFRVVEAPQICSVHFGDQKINFHRPELWPRKEFTLRAPAATPPCGDLCFVWDGSLASLQAMLAAAAAQVVEGPVPRQGGRDGGAARGTSVYVRDPDGNLLEFITYSG